MFNKIIVGDNGAGGGRDAVALAHALAPDAELLLTGVYPFDERPSRGRVAGYAELLREDTVTALEHTRTEAGVPSARVVTIADVSPARGLYRRAERDGADLIVVGSSHRGRVGRSLLGDVGRSVLHGAPCPVAVAPRGFDGHPPQVIGVAYDHSVESSHALAIAAAVARAHGARLVVRYVVENDLAFGGYPAASLDAIYQASRSHAQGVVDEAIAGLGVPAEGVAVLGRLSDALVALAAEVDLVVCGSRGWGPVRRVALGSTADHLIHHAPCPVLVVPRTAVVAQEVGLDAVPAPA